MCARAGKCSLSTDSSLKLEGTGWLTGATPVPLHPKVWLPARCPSTPTSHTWEDYQNLECIDQGGLGKERKGLVLQGFP